MSCRANYFLQKFHARTQKIVPTQFISSGAQFNKNACPNGGGGGGGGTVNIDVSSLIQYLSVINSTIISINPIPYLSIINSTVQAIDLNQNININIDTCEQNRILCRILSSVNVISKEISSLGPGGGGGGTQDVRQEVNVNVDFKNAERLLSSIDKKLNSLSSIDAAISTINDKLDNLSTVGGGAGTQDVRQEVNVNVDFKNAERFLSSIDKKLNSLSSIDAAVSTINDKLDNLSTVGGGAATQDVKQNVVVNVDFEGAKKYLSSIDNKLNILSSIDTKLTTLSTGVQVNQDVVQNADVKVDLTSLKDYLSSLIYS